MNLAFRLESLAEPGGVLISEPVYSSMRANLPVLVEHAGDHVFGALALATRAYRVPVQACGMDGRATAQRRLPPRRPLKGPP